MSKSHTRKSKASGSTVRRIADIVRGSKRVNNERREWSRRHAARLNFEG